MINLRLDFFHRCFREGKRCGAMKDGHYHRQNDNDFIWMYCMGGEL
jgi:hypothetical protein